MKLFTSITRYFALTAMALALVMPFCPGITHGATTVTADLITIGPWVDSRAYATINAAEAAAYAAGKTLKVFVPQVLAASLTVRCALDIEPGGKIIKASGYTLTVNGPFRAPDQQVFQGFGVADITFGAAAITEGVRVNWFATNTTQGTTDMADAVHAAINAAAGRLVLFGIGEYRMTSSLDHNVTATEIRVRGAVPAYITHGVVKTAYAYSSDYTPASIDIPSGRFTVIQMDGANLIGADDTASLGSSGKLKYLGNIFAYGNNNAKVGVYAQPYDTVIEDSHFALFKNFGILLRSGMTGSIRRVGFADNGWGLAESGTPVYPYSYISGCQYRVISNLTAGDYTTIDPASRATTLSTDTTFFSTRGHTAQNMSGYRGAQISGLISGTMKDMQGYTASIYMAAAVAIEGPHIENYSYHGLTASDSLPYCIYSVNSSLSVSAGLLSNATVTTQPVIYQSPDGTNTLHSAVSTTQDGLGLKSAVIRSEKVVSVTVGAPGTAPTYSLFPNLFNDAEGFTGLVVVTITSGNDNANYATATYMVHRHLASGVLKVPTGLQLYEYHSGTGAYLAQVTNIVPNSTAGLDITIDWGASWGAADTWWVSAGALGSTSISSP